MTNEMLMEDWLRGCVHHDGRNGYVTLPCDEVMKIADYIESTRTKVDVIRCKDCEHMHDNDCPIHWGKTETDYCSYGEQGEADE